MDEISAFSFNKLLGDLMSAKLAQTTAPVFASISNIAALADDSALIMLDPIISFSATDATLRPDYGVDTTYSLKRTYWVSSPFISTKVSSVTSNTFGSSIFLRVA